MRVNQAQNENTTRAKQFIDFTGIYSQGQSLW